MCRKDGLVRVRKSLAKKRDDIRAELDKSRALLASPPLNFPVDVVEAAVGTAEAEMNSLQVEVKSRQLKGVQEALAMAKTGNLGVCQTCGKDIPLARLQAVPGATRCVKCQQKTEQSSLGSAQRTSYAFLANLSSDDETVGPEGEPVG